MGTREEPRDKTQSLESKQKIHKKLSIAKKLVLLVSLD